MTRNYILIAGVFGVVLGACGGGQYGYTRTYEPLSEESDYLEAASPTPYEDVHRDPAAFRQTHVAWFGVVTDVRVNGEEAIVSLTYRTHQERHLCADEREDSCRVTISARPGEEFSVRLRLHEEDRSGRKRLWVGSLLKVYGTPTGELDAQGGPVLTAQYYRHWPHGTYVTTQAAGGMRQ